jgi:peptide/nickel transport system permease protein
VVMLAWMGPTLVIRAQVLTMKERQFVSVAKLSGVSDMGIIFKEILPNLLPFIAASFVGQVFAAVFASFYLAVLGLGRCASPCSATSSGPRSCRAHSSMAGGGGPSPRRWR